MKILIVGGGELAETIVQLIGSEGNEIIVIEKDEARKRELETKYDILVIRRDATDVEVYTREVKMDEIDAVLALTNSDEINMLVLAIAKLNNIPIRIGRFAEEKIGELVREMGLGISVVQPKVLASILANYMLSVRAPLTLGKVNDLNLYLVGVTEGDQASGMKISELGLDPKTCKVILILDGKGFRVPSEDDTLKAGDSVFILAPNDDFVKYIKG
ncbi:MAG: NAD-binding protein [Desulfurococcaceae archaeon]